MKVRNAYQSKTPSPPKSHRKLTIRGTGGGGSPQPIAGSQGKKPVFGEIER
jgi:hypothetical protein